MKFKYFIMRVGLNHTKTKFLSFRKKIEEKENQCTVIILYISYCNVTEVEPLKCLWSFVWPCH